MANEANVAPEPIMPTKLLGTRRKPSPLIKKPISGNKGIRATRDIFLKFENRYEDFFTRELKEL